MWLRQQQQQDQKDKMPPSYNISSRDIFPLVESAGTGNKYQLIHFVCKGSIQGRRDFFFPRALVVHAKEEEKTSGNENRPFFRFSVAFYYQLYNPVWPEPQNQAAHIQTF